MINFPETDPLEPTSDPRLARHLAYAHITLAIQELGRVPSASLELLGADWTTRLGRVLRDLESLREDTRVTDPED